MVGDFGVAIPSADVALVLMPYAAVERPSIALGILKTVLARAGIRATVVYGNVLFAQEIGVYAHDVLGKTHSGDVAAEWTFARAAFPGAARDDDAYFGLVGGRLRHADTIAKAYGLPDDVRALMTSARERAPEFVARLARAVVASGARVVGCSSSFQQHCASLALLREVKELDPGIATVLGGANCEASMGIATHRECRWVDYVVSGEGEDVFLALCRALLEGAVGDALPEGAIGPAHRANGYAAIAAAPPRARIEDMNRSPIPEYDDYFRTIYGLPVGAYVKPSLLVEMSRGCWWGAVSHCTFCGLNGSSMAYRAKDAGRVVDELDTLARRWRMKGFEVVDNILDMKYFSTLLPALEERGEEYDIFFETKANLTRKHVRQLAAAGVRWIQPGIEQLDDVLLKLIAKGTTARQNLQLLKWAHDYGVCVVWVFLHDIPGDDDEAYAAMARWIPVVEHLQPPSFETAIDFNRFSPYVSRPEAWDLHLEAAPAYRHVFPWPAQSIDEFAYFFADIPPRTAPGRPGVTAALNAIASWKAAWFGGAPPPALLMRRDGARIVLTDTRRCRVADEHVLDGDAALVFDACDKALNAGGIVEDVSARLGNEIGWERLAPVVRELVDRKVALESNGFYLSLATTRRLPGEVLVDYPSGRLHSPAEAEAARLVRLLEGRANDVLPA